MLPPESEWTTDERLLRLYNSSDRQALPAEYDAEKSGDLLAQIMLLIESRLHNIYKIYIPKFLAVICLLKLCFAFESRLDNIRAFRSENFWQQKMNK
jgi:hypothetical protein